MCEESSTNPPSPEPLSEEKRKVLEFHLSLYSFNETANLLGRVSIEFQFLETEIREAISFLINRSDEWIGKIVTGGMQFGNLIDLLCCLFDHIVEDEAAFETFHKIEERCRGCVSKRNALVHSLWYPNLKDKKGAKTVVVTRRTQKMKVDVQDVVKADLLKIADEIESCRNDLNTLWRSVFPEYKQFLGGKP